MNKICVKFLVIYLFLSAFLSVQGQKQFIFDQLTVEDGLARNNIRAICRDYLGYIWIGTIEGLNKFDGANMYSYFSNPKLNSSLPHNEISFIVEDDSLNLWVGTPQGLALYDRTRDEFAKIDLDSVPNGFNSFCKLKGRMVFGSQIGMVIYDCKTKQFEYVNLPNIDPGLTVNQLLRLNDDEILLAALNGGAWKYNLSTKKFSPFAKDQMTGVQSIILDESGLIWVATIKNGIKLFDLNGEELEDPFVKQIIDPNYHLVRDMVERDGKVWISTDGAGIFIIDRKTQSIRHLQERRGVENSLPANSISDLFVDDFGNMLGGSVRAGLIWIHEGYIQSYSDVATGNPYGLTNSSVQTVFEDHKGNIWIGTDGGGLNLYNPETNTFEHFNELNTAHIASICSFGKDKLLVSCWRDYIRVFDTKRKKFIDGPQYEWLRTQSEQTSQIIVHLKKDQSGRIWKLHENISILGLDGSVEPVNSTYGWKGVLPSETFCLQILNDHEILLGGLNSVCRLNLKEKTITTIFSFKDPRWWDGKEQGYVYSFAKDGDMVWMSSSRGLFSYDSKTNQVEHHPSNLFRSTHGVAMGNNNTLWIGTSRGLYRYFSDQGHYQLFGRAEGVLGFEFIRSSVLKAGSGDVYLGAVEGLVEISADEEFEETNLSQQISFANIMADGAPLYNVDTRGQAEKGIQLAWDNASLKINLVVNEKSLFRKRIFRVLLEGYSEEAFETTEPQITFTHLPAGKYTLKVWCNRADGSWSDEFASLKVHVPLPWWKQWWFISGIILSIVLLFFLIIDNLKKRSALSMELQLEQERRNQMKWLNEQKLVFFTNISHEFRTPLTLIIAPILEMVEKASEYQLSEEVGRKLSVVNSNAQHLLRLVSQLIDFRKSESGQMKLNASPNDISQFVYEIGIPFKELAEINNINFKTVDKLKEKEVWVDRDKLEMIINNLLSNAFKYVSAKGHVVLTLTGDKENVYLQVEDDGKGIPAKEIDKIFDRFYQVEGEKDFASSGIGLALTKRLVLLHQGEISVESTSNERTVFTIKLPKGDAHLSEDQKELSSRERGATSFVMTAQMPTIIEREVTKKKTAEEQAVLVVEDNIEVQSYLSGLLKPYYHVITASDGQEGWDFALQKNPDLIISDVMMPLMDGFELCGKLKSDDRTGHIPIILLTAKTADQFRLTGTRKGADDYISKPFDPHFLLEKINQLLKARSKMEKKFSKKIHLGPEELEISPIEEKIITKAKKIIEDNMSNYDFDTQMLASEIGMSHSSLYRKLAPLTQCPPAEFIRRIRLERAAQLLADPEKTISEIALEVGFLDLKNFRTWFQKQFSFTPSEYRRRLKNNPKKPS